jgi:hypothetical protein
MKKIRIHRFENVLWGRAHLPFFKKLDIYLSKFFNLEVINYNKDGETFSGQIDLLKSTGQFGNRPPLSDVDYVIENMETGDVKVVSFTEYFNSYISHLAKSENTSDVLLAHFNWQNMYYWMKGENAINHLYKIKPYIFLPFQEFDIEYYRNKRKEITEFNDKIFWLGCGLDSYRSTLKYIVEEGLMQPIESSHHELYMTKLISSKIGLSFYLNLDKYNTPYDHPGEFCYRDIEFISCGLPFIRIEFKDSVRDPLLPNHHYISIPREHAYVAYSKEGDEGVAKLYMDRYREVINDQEFLDYISKNQIEWGNRNLIGENKEKLTFEWLNLKDWL